MLSQKHFNEQGINMSRIKIETLSAVHIGSGDNLQYGADFVSGKYQDNDMLAVVDLRKIAALIGKQNIPFWVAAIEKGDSTAAIVKRFAPKASIADYAKRLVLQWADIRNSDTLKEQIHDGRGVPYIPGSSIKGAIRTAVLGSLAKELPDLENKLKNRFGRVTAELVESELFGGNPNKDVFRFLQVGDAYFGKNYEVAIRMVNINERERQGFWDESKSQLIEAICPEDKAEFQMKINQAGFDLSKGEHQISKIPDCLGSQSALFETINAHTLYLLETEKEYWEEREANDDTDSVADYLDRITNMINAVNHCEKGKECVLRIGHGSGWRFITGAWTEDLDNFASLIVPASRPANYKYTEYDFPKTRRVDDQCELLGFVKLILLE